MGPLPALTEGVKCTYFVLRKEFLGDKSQQSGRGRASSLSPPSERTASGHPEEAETCRGPIKTAPSRRVPPRTATQLETMASSPTSRTTPTDHMELELAGPCKHLISQALGEEEGSGICEFCRGERLVEEAARNNDLLADEDDLTLEQSGGLLPDVGDVNCVHHQPSKKGELSEFRVDIASTPAAKPFKRLWRTLCSPHQGPEPAPTHPLVLASVRIGKMSSRLLVYYPKSTPRAFC